MILLMTTAPPRKAPWIFGRRLPPLGLAYVAAALEEAGFQVKILDNYLLKHSTDEVKDYVRRLSPRIVGITCGSVTYQRCIETAKAIKEVCPTCKVVAGGPHPSYMPESTLKNSEIDYVVIGEGERAMTELARYITKGDKKSSIPSIPGVSYRNNGETIKTAPEFIEDLDQIPYPARHLLPMHLYNRKIEFLNVKPVDTMNVIRGCPFNCAFCEIRRLWGYRSRSFSPSRIVGEIKQLVTNFGSRGIYFVGDNFTIQKKKTIEMCELIKKQQLDIEWVCDTRVDLVSRELLKKMKTAGCKTIWFGVESGSPRVLKNINRGITLQQADRAFKLCKEVGIQTACSFMLGTPGETARDREATIEFAKKLNPDWCRFNIFVAYPDSTLYREILQEGLYDKNKSEEFVLYVKTEDFDHQSLLEVKERFHRELNRSPRRKFLKIKQKMKQEGILTSLRKGIENLSFVS